LIFFSLLGYGAIEEPQRSGARRSQKQEASLHKTREAIAAYKNLKLGRIKKSIPEQL
jgi:hypothetical protein